MRWNISNLNPNLTPFNKKNFARDHPFNVGLDTEFIKSNSPQINEHKFNEQQFNQEKISNQQFSEAFSKNDAKFNQFNFPNECHSGNPYRESRYSDTCNQWSNSVTPRIIP